MEITTIRLSKKTKKEFREKEIHPRETDEDIIKRLIKESEQLKKRVKK